MLPKGRLGRADGQEAEGLQGWRTQPARRPEARAARPARARPLRSPMAVVSRFYGTGRRKTSVARVWLRAGSGRILINRRPFEDYFPRETLRMVISQPLQLTNTFGQFDAVVNVGGGRPTGQAGAGAPTGSRGGAAPVRRQAPPDAQARRPPHPRSADEGAQEVRAAGRARSSSSTHSGSRPRGRHVEGRGSPGPARVHGSGAAPVSCRPSQGAHQARSRPSASRASASTGSTRTSAAQRSYVPGDRRAAATRRGRRRIPRRCPTMESQR